jgi:hypothetical protein
MPFSIRLDPDTEKKIRRLAKATATSKSAVVREAMAQYDPDGAPAPDAAGAAFDRLTPFVGIVRTGGADFSRDTHAKYRAAVARKHRGRRPR